MSTKDQVQVDGFLFEEEETAKIAARESEGVRYLKEKMPTDHPEKVLELYNKMVEDHMFETPVGLSFLGNLRETLEKAPELKQELILPVPVRKVKGSSNRISETKEEDRFYRQKFRASFIINLILAAVIVVMVIISMKGETVTIVNYENKIINKYEDWEQELEQREEKIKQYEKEYGIENDSESYQK